MTTSILSGVRSGSDLLAIAFVALLGLGIVGVAGFASASAAHDAAHDTRHATGFPCH